MKGFSVTYERWDESALEAGDTDDRGFVIEDVSLREAMRWGLEYREPRWSGACEADSYPPRDVRWLTFHTWNEGTHESFVNGIKESRSLHFPDNLTESSRKRICRLFRAYGCK